MRAGNSWVYASLSSGLLIVTLLPGCHRGSAQGNGPPPGESGPPIASDHRATVDESVLVGDWRGESKVQATNTTAKDEVVVWHIAKGSEPKKLVIDADKIVDDMVIPMGKLDFDFDAGQQAIVCQTPRGVWKLVVKGDTMEGTLTLADQTVFRRVTLQKSASLRQ
jgi:hypothetical protein